MIRVDALPFMLATLAAVRDRLVPIAHLHNCGRAPLTQTPGTMRLPPFGTVDDQDHEMLKETRICTRAVELSK